MIAPAAVTAVRSGDNSQFVYLFDNRILDNNPMRNLLDFLLLPTVAAPLFASRTAPGCGNTCTLLHPIQTRKTNTFRTFSKRNAEFYICIYRSNELLCIRLMKNYYFLSLFLTSAPFNAGSGKREPALNFLYLSGNKLKVTRHRTRQPELYPRFLPFRIFNLAAQQHRFLRLVHHFEFFGRVKV